MEFRRKESIFPAFVIRKTLEKNLEADLNRKSRFYFEWSSIITLLLLTVIFIIFPRFKKNEPVPFTTLNAVFHQVDIPQTRQGGGLTLPKQPDKPAVPIPSDIDEMAEDVTIEFPDRYYPDLPFESRGTGGGYGVGTGIGSGGGSVSTGPRPISEHFPKYLESAKKKGQRGIIELLVKIDEKGIPVEVKVVRNTTGSKELENEAIKATMKSRYRPAKDPDGKNQVVWVPRTYSFGL